MMGCCQGTAGHCRSGAIPVVWEPRVRVIANLKGVLSVETPMILAAGFPRHRKKDDQG